MGPSASSLAGPGPGSGVTNKLSRLPQVLPQVHSLSTCCIPNCHFFLTACYILGLRFGLWASKIDTVRATRRATSEEQVAQTGRPEWALAGQQHHHIWTPPKARTVVPVGISVHSLEMGPVCLRSSGSFQPKVVCPSLARLPWVSHQ